MPRVSAVYKLGEKTVIKGGYGLYYDTLNAADYGQNNAGFSATTTNTNSTDFGQTFLLGNPYAGQLGFADPFPVRADGTRFDEPTGPRSASTPSPARTTPSRTRTTSTRVNSAGASACSGSSQGTCRWKWRTTVRIRTASRSASGRITCRAVLDSRQPQRPRHRGPGVADGQRDQPVHAVEFRGAADDGSRALPAHGRQRLLHGDDHAAPPAAAALLADQQPRLRQPAAARGQGAFAAAQRQSALRGWVHRERRDVVQQQPHEPHRRGIRPRADALVGRQQQPAVPCVGRRGLRAAVRRRQADAEQRRGVGGARRRVAAGGTFDTSRDR